MEIDSYRFGPFQVRSRARELYKHGTKLRLRPQPFQVLQLLVKRAGDIVTRDELRRNLWPDKTFVDFEHGLNTSIKELRSTLSDSASRPKYIETLPKLGYRLIIPVEVQEPAETGPTIAEPPTTSTGSDGAGVPLAAKRPPLARWLWFLMAGTVVLLLGTAGRSWRWPHWLVPPPTVGDRLILAVLPFENLTGDAGQDYLADGLTEEMIAQLGRLDAQGLGVIARTSVMHYKHSAERLNQIGRELNVEYVLEGSVRRDSDQIRISAQLIRVKDETHLWAREYDRKLTNVLAVQDETAREISNQIQLALGNQKSRAPTSRPALTPEQYEAYDLYLKGLYFWNKRSFQQAIEYFQQSVTKDPNHARSYAGIADCYTLIGEYSAMPRSEYATKARTVALRALELDDTLPEAHAALALIVQNYDGNWQTAEKEYRRAIDLNPSYATAHHWYAEHLGFRGRFEEAFRESRRALQLDPLSLIIAADNAVLLYYARQYDRAIAEFRSVLQMDPHFSRAQMVVFSYVETGRFAEALAGSQALLREHPDGPWNWSLLAYVYGRMGQKEQARQALEKLNQLNRVQPIDPRAFFWAYLGLGNKDQVFAWMEKAYAQSRNSFTALRVDPLYDPLRMDPRFQDLLRRVGLTP